MITIVMVLVLIVVLAVYYCWSMETAASVMELAVLSAESTESTASTSAVVMVTKKHFSRNGVKQYLRKAALEEQLDDIALPHKSNHLFSEATGGEWDKYGYSHYGKGVTLRDYRRGTHLSKKCLHPCMGGESGDRFD